MRTLLKRAVAVEKAFLYFLYDTFSTDKAAGSVNGTFADTGQQRTVTDTNSKLSVTGGVASVATGGNTAGDPGLWYPSMTRQLGLTVLGGVFLTANICELGWDTSAAGAIGFCVRLSIGGI